MATQFGSREEALHTVVLRDHQEVMEHRCMGREAALVASLERNRQLEIPDSRAAQLGISPAMHVCV